MFRHECDKRSGPVRRLCTLEQLETRELLSASFGHGLWTIRGDAVGRGADDQITIDRDPGSPGTLRAWLNGEMIDGRDAAEVARIRIFAGRGDDSVRIDESIAATLQPLTIYGGAGEDVLEGGSGDDLLVGGPGQDALSGNGGADRLRGGSGADRLEGGVGPDKLQGDEGRDSIEVEPIDKYVKATTRSNRLADQDDVILVDEMQSEPPAQALPIEPEPKPIVPEIRHIDGGRPVSTDHHQVTPVTIDEAEELKHHLIDATIERWKGLLGKPWDNRYEENFGHLNIDRGWLPGLDLHPAGNLAALQVAADEGIDTVVAGGSPAFSQTNTQVQGVDEADIVKTDGNYLYIIAGQELIIVNAVPARKMQVVSRRTLEGTPVALYLMDDHVMVISRTVSDWRSQQLDNGSQAYILGSVVLDPQGLPTGYAQTKVTLLDVANRTEPLLIQETYLDGYYEESRAIRDKAYLVLRNDLPQMPEPAYACTHIEDPAALSVTLQSSYGYEQCAYEDEASYRRRLEPITIDVMPEFTSRVSGIDGMSEYSGDLVEFGKIYAAYDAPDSDLVTVVMIDAGGQPAGPPVTMSVLGPQIIVYASVESLYVVASNSSGWSLRGWSAGESTQIFKINLTSEGVALAAVGEVPGSALNQFSMDEHDGYFRIATTTGSGGWWSENNFSNSLIVLTQQGDQLTIVGGLEAIAPSERIYSARFMGDRAYLVTFRNTDPLFTFDLSDPAQPQLVGELVIPGFSTYLQPIDENHLLALGRQVDWNEPFGLQIAIFDVSDMAHPARTHLYSFGSNLWGEGSEAERDHHAFSYFPEQGVLALPVSHGEWFGQSSGSSAGLEILRVTLDQGFSMLGRIEHQTDVRRGLRIGDILYSISSDAVKAQPILTPEHLIAEVDLSTN